MGCVTCADILAGKVEGRIIPDEWRQYIPHIVIVLVIIGAFLLLRRNKKK